MDTIHLEVLLDILAFVTTAVLGLVIFFPDKHSWVNRLFNLKIFAAQIFVFILWVLLFAQAVTASSWQERIKNGLVFFATIIIGIYLVRSAQRETRQRETLESLTEELATSNQKLQNLDQARSDFITIASHQLRTPPTTLKWYLSAIRSGDYGKLDESLRSAVAKAEAVNNSLIALIDDLLNASRIERGKMEFLFEPTDMMEVVRVACEQMEPLASIKSLRLSFQKPAALPPLVVADKEKIRQVVNNFVDNAIKYTSTGQVQVFLREEVGKVVVEVEDTGKGFDEQTGKVLFQKYTRGQDAAVHSTGLGLGLYVAKVVISQHSGEIWGKSDGVGKGSKFGFSLPIHNDLPEHASLNLTPAEAVDAQGS